MFYLVKFKNECHQPTSKKIQVAKLMLPKMPDKASFHDSTLESVASATSDVVAMAMVMVVGDEVGKREVAHEGEKRLHFMERRQWHSHPHLLL
jgi:hypothetical protein